MELLEENITAIISTIRHGEKDELGKLTLNGFLQGINKGKQTRHLKGDIVLVHSGVDRVKDTLLSFANYLGNKEVAVSEDLIKNLKNYNSYISHYLQYLYDSSNKGLLFKSWDNIKDNEACDRRMNEFLNLRDFSPEPDIFPSPKHMAIRVARVLATEIDFATITIPEVRTNFINGTHEPVIMAFLYYFLQNFQPKLKNFTKVIGGSVNYSEGFEIRIYQDLKGDNRVIFKFRDIIKDVDQVKLKEFCLSEKVR